MNPREMNEASEQISPVRPREVATAKRHRMMRRLTRQEGPALRSLFKTIVGHKVGRYLMCGVGTAGFNLVLLVLAIEGLSIETAVGRNLANLVCTELSVLFSFVVYKVLVWRDTRWRSRRLLFYQISAYHASVAVALVLRTLVAFPLLDLLGIKYTINLLIGIALAAVVNFIASDRIVFRMNRDPVASFGKP